MIDIQTYMGKNNSNHEPIRISIIGTASRSSYMYGPIIRALPSECELVSVWGRSEKSSKELGERLNVPWFTDIDKLIKETAPQIGIVCVAYDANGEIGLMSVESGLNVLLETPIAHNLHEADEIIRVAVEKNLKIEVAEQFHRRPFEQLKLKMIQSGIFGDVYTSFNDFCGHGYHGVSVLRSYLGFDLKPIQVTGNVKQFDLAPHWSRLADTRSSRVETQEHGIIEFEGGKLGIYHWTDVGYDSAFRWWRSSRFLAEKGMGITVGVGMDVEEKLSILSPNGEGPQFLSLERRWERVDGGSLVALIARSPDPNTPDVRWDYPFLADIQGHGVQWHDDEIGVASCLMSLVNAIRTESEPTYGPKQARLDQELILAIRASAEENGLPIKIPFSEKAF